MASTLVVRLIINEDGTQTIGLHTTHHDYLQCARIGVLREPYGPLQSAAAVHALVRAWMSPELSADAAEALHATFEGLTTPF